MKLSTEGAELLYVGASEKATKLIEKMIIESLSTLICALALQEAERRIAEIGS